MTKWLSGFVAAAALLVGAPAFAQFGYNPDYGFIESGGGFSGALSSALNANSFRLYDSTDELNLGTSAEGTNATATGDVLVGGKLEVDGILYADTGILMPNSNSITMGWAGRVTLSSVQTNMLTINPTGGAAALQFAAGGLFLQSEGSSLGIFNSAGSAYLAINVSNVNAGGGYVRGGKLVTAKATAYTLSATSDRGQVFTNEGATARLDVTLPTAAANVSFIIHVQDADGIKLIAGAGDTIQIGAAAASGAAGYVCSTVKGSSFEIIAINATEWVALSPEGTWTTDSGC